MFSHNSTFFFLYFCYNLFVQRKRGVRQVNSVSGEIIGDIRITVCQTTDGYNFYQIQADNESVLPVVNIIEHTLIEC